VPLTAFSAEITRLACPGAPGWTIGAPDALRHDAPPAAQARSTSDTGTRVDQPDTHKAYTQTCGAKR
jgi:hypothetical protein